MGPYWTKMAQDEPKIGQDGRKMAEDAEHELEDAAQDRQDAVPERLRRAKMKKVVRQESVQGRFGVRPCGMRGPALDYV